MLTNRHLIRAVTGSTIGHYAVLDKLGEGVLGASRYQKSQRRPPPRPEQRPESRRVSEWWDGISNAAPARGL